VAFVKSRNLHRRHMTGSQRALVVVACSEWVANGSRATPEPGSGVSEKQMAADVSERMIRLAKVVAAEASPEVVEAVKAGEMSLKAAVVMTNPTVAMPIPRHRSGFVKVCHQLTRRWTAWRHRVAKRPTTAHARHSHATRGASLTVVP
jgi:hypothetical protein